MEGWWNGGAVYAGRCKDKGRRHLVLEHDLLEVGGRSRVRVEQAVAPPAEREGVEGVHFIMWIA